MTLNKAKSSEFSSCFSSFLTTMKFVIASATWSSSPCTIMLISACTAASNESNVIVCTPASNCSSHFVYSARLFVWSRIETLVERRNTWLCVLDKQQRIIEKYTPNWNIKKNRKANWELAQVHVHFQVNAVQRRVFILLFLFYFFANGRLKLHLFCLLDDAIRTWTAEFSMISALLRIIHNCKKKKHLILVRIVEGASERWSPSSISDAQNQLLVISTQTRRS